MDQEIRPFDAGALYRALDAKRSRLGLSWKAVADQIWELSGNLNDRRRDHPISPSTIANIERRRRPSCQHALFMRRWLGRTPESFLRDADGDDQRFALPEVGTDRRLRWALKRLYAAMNEKRKEQSMTWPALAAVLGCTPDELMGLRTAKFATGMDVAMGIMQWLDRPAADFVYAATW
jgi:transcriptional regulator with XRE-family HTH domain